MSLSSRNTTSGFAARTFKNLRQIENDRARGDDVHVVTQRVISLLGLVVFRQQEGITEDLGSASLGSLSASGWPTWNIVTGDAPTLNTLVRHVRNAVAHGHIRFSSESRDPTGVFIEFTDSGAQAKWQPNISADDLLAFCERFHAATDQ